MQKHGENEEKKIKRLEEKLVIVERREKKRENEKKVNKLKYAEEREFLFKYSFFFNSSPQFLSIKQSLFCKTYL